jgi:hypothetical protein
MGNCKRAVLALTVVPKSESTPGLYVASWWARTRGLRAPLSHPLSLPRAATTAPSSCGDRPHTPSRSPTKCRSTRRRTTARRASTTRLPRCHSSRLARAARARVCVSAPSSRAPTPWPTRTAPCWWTPASCDAACLSAARSALAGRSWRGSACVCVCVVTLLPPRSGSAEDDALASWGSGHERLLVDLPASYALSAAASAVREALERARVTAPESLTRMRAGAGPARWGGAAQLRAAYLSVLRARHARGTAAPLP